VVENRPGAAGVLADEQLGRATDGHIFLMTSGSVGAALRPGQLPHDVLRDFAPIGLFATAANGICVHASVPANMIGAFMKPAALLRACAERPALAAGGDDRAAASRAA